ncbi:septum site-determining protein Ssd [Corynebacterium kutscheri]|nr:septum site-determining protein Ssd [Corynebacterium kutscheri]
MKEAPIFMAITDPIIHPEAAHIIAASGHNVIDSIDPREMTRHAHRVAALLVDATTAAHAATLPINTRIFLLYPETEEIDWKLVATMRADGAFILPAQSPELLAALSENPQHTGTKGSVIVVVSATGGAGCSTCAAWLSTVIPNAVLLDADAYSGGLDLLLGIEDRVGVRWGDLNFLSGGINPEDLLKALPHHEQTRVLTISRTGDHGLGCDQVLAAINCLREHCNVVVDTPVKYVEEIADASDITIVLVPAELRPVAAASRLIQVLRSRRVETVVLVRNRSWAGLSEQEVAHYIDHEVLGVIKHEKRLVKAVENTGLPAASKEIRSLCDLIHNAA